MGVDQKRVVIIADPAGTAVGGRQAVIAGVVDPVARAIEQRVQAEADAEPRISVTAIRVVIARHPVMAAVPLAIAAPVIAAVAPPVAIPPVLPAVIVPPIDAIVVVAVIRSEAHTSELQ